MNADKDAIVEMLATAADLVENVNGNEDALNKAIDHIEEAIALIEMYVIDE